MNAVRINEWGQPAQVEEIPQPLPGAGEVLVRVRAAGVNKVDAFIAAGYLQSMLTLPMTLGTDLAGDVVAVGEGVTHVQVGDAVYGFISFRGGAFAEYAVAKASEVARKPETLDYIQAAAVPLVAMTAYQPLFDIAKVQPGERVLVHGAGGGVGSFATQLAKHAGAYVIGTASAEKAEHLEALGLDEHIDYQAQPFETLVSDVDVVVDTVGGDLVQRSYAVLKPGGRLVTSAAQITPEEAEAQAQNKGLSISGVMAHADVEQLTRIAELIDAGKLKVFVDTVLPLEQVQAALEQVMGGHPTGKVVLSIG